MDLVGNEAFRDPAEHPSVGRLMVALKIHWELICGGHRVCVVRGMYEGQGGLLREMCEGHGGGGVYSG